MATDIKHTDSAYTSQNYFSSHTDPNYNYKNVCEVCIPIVFKVPICIEAEIIAKKPTCSKKNGHHESPPVPVPVPEG